MKLRPELNDIVRALAAAAEDTREVPIDAIGDALGARAATHEEIDAMIAELERRGLRVTSPTEGPMGEARLREVLDAARALREERGRPATAREIAEKTGLAIDAVRHALELVKVMQR